MTDCMGVDFCPRLLQNVEEFIMYELLTGDQRILKILPSFIFRDTEYRIMDYCLSEIVGDETIMFNLLNRKMVLIEENEEYESMNKYLIENGFLVPRDFDEYNLFLNLKKMLKKVSKITSKGIHNFTIFTTTACNARCYYCFEKNTPVITMSKKIAEQVADFIFNNVPSDEIAYIRWFGGEPLLNCEIIDNITNRLQTLGVKFKSSIITNATLFSKEIIEKSVVKWNVDTVQVTLDGTKDVHDKIKSISNSVIYSAFDRTITNIHCLLDKGINVQIRLNLSENNKNNLLTLIDYIDKEFVDKQNLSIYCKSLFEKVQGKDCTRKLDEECALRNTQYKINEKIFNLGLYKKRISDELKSSICAAATGDVVTILPNGNIGLCEHNELSECIGNVYDGIITGDNIKKYSEEIPIRRQCKKCPVLPECNRQMVCDAVVNYCAKEKQNVMIQEVKMQMRNVRKNNETKI